MVCLLIGLLSSSCEDDLVMERQPPSIASIVLLYFLQVDSQGQGVEHSQLQPTSTTKLPIFATKVAKVATVRIGLTTHLDLSVTNRILRLQMTVLQSLG